MMYSDTEFITEEIKRLEKQMLEKEKEISNLKKREQELIFQKENEVNPFQQSRQKREGLQFEILEYSIDCKDLQRFLNPIVKFGNAVRTVFDFDGTYLIYDFGGRERKIYEGDYLIRLENGAFVGHVPKIIFDLLFERIEKHEEN